MMTASPSESGARSTGSWRPRALGTRSGRFDIDGDEIGEIYGLARLDGSWYRPVAVSAKHQAFTCAECLAKQGAPERRRAACSEDVGDEHVFRGGPAAFLNEDLSSLAQEGVTSRLTTGGVLRRT